MASKLHSLPSHFRDRALTAEYIVGLYQRFQLQSGKENTEVDELTPPAHLDEEMASDCRCIAKSLSHAAQNKYHVAWSATKYAKDAPKVSPFNIRREDSLMHKYPPLTPLPEVVGNEGHLRVLEEPAVITDVEGNVLVCSLPNIIPPHRQESILQIVSELRDIMKTKTPRSRDGPNAQLKGWRTSPTFFSKDGEWGYGATLLHPAGFPQGQKGSPKGPTLSQDATTHSAARWMKDFQVVGGLLDGILAVVHPSLYRAALALIDGMYANHPASRAVLALWPTCFLAAHIIANRETVRHRDVSSAAGWLDLLLTLGSYGEKAVMELRNLGICVPYDAGSIVLLTSRLVVHGVPKVPTDRICLAFYMVHEVFKWFEAEDVGMTMWGADIAAV